MASLKEGDTIFVHASASGVGTSLIQLAKLKNAKVIASASTNQKLEFVKNLGADLTGRSLGLILERNRPIKKMIANGVFK